MPMIETKPDALAFTYARSFFFLAEGKGGRALIEEVLGQLEDILDLAFADKKFGEFLSSRALGMKDRAGSLERIFKGRVDDLTYQFLQILNRKGRLQHLAGITAAFDSLVQAKFGRIEVDVITAESIPPDALNSLRQRLATALKKEVIAHPYVDPSMIGGVKLKIGDQLVDGSIATQLRRIRDRLEVEGLGMLRSRADRIVGE
jgi:F-type H+-transporting ATPase subunit delta